VARHDIPKVIGGLDPQASEIASALYGSIFRRTVPVSSPAAAEMTKLLENIYRCVNIALVNELKMLCLRMDLNIWEIIDAAATKPFGFHPFYPGPGLGGHCIPVDPFYLSWKAKEFDFHTRFIELAGEINVAMPYHVIASTISALNRQKKAINGSKVLVLGVAYKKDIDDLRESPALTIIELLQKEGATVSYNDPYFPFVGRGRKYDLQMKCSPLDNLGQYDCVLIVTDHTDYDYKKIVARPSWWWIRATPPAASRATRSCTAKLRRFAGALAPPASLTTAVARRAPFRCVSKGPFPAHARFRSTMCPRHQPELLACASISRWPRAAFGYRASRCIYTVCR
jgi:UDP-N-acetyl-D-glucosamine dehydrogenase